MSKAWRCFTPHMISIFSLVPAGRCSTALIFSKAQHLVCHGFWLDYSAQFRLGKTPGSGLSCASLTRVLEMSGLKPLIGCWRKKGSRLAIISWLSYVVVDVVVVILMIMQCLPVTFIWNAVSNLNYIRVYKTHLVLISLTESVEEGYKHSTLY